MYTIRSGFADTGRAIRPLVLFAAMVCWFTGPQFMKAATSHTVQMTSSFTFVPATLTIAKGDTVIWNNASGISHTSTSGSGCLANGRWDSGSVFSGTTYTRVFNDDAGNYPYFCTPHCSLFGMVGTIIVTNAANAPPSVAITNPTAGAVFAAPANVTIQANASDSDGSITNVEFLVGSTVLANDTTVPYAATTNGLQAGNYTLTAIASDNAGAKATNAVNIIVDVPPSISLTNPVTGSKFHAPAAIALMAAASDTDGSVTNVRFFSGASLLGSVAGAPYTFTVSNVSVGDYTFTAEAADDRGLAATSAPVNVLVVSIPVLASPVQMANGQFQFAINGTAAQKYATEVSTDLTSWLAISTNTAPSNTFTVVDPSATNFDLRFYRVREVP